LNSTWLGEPLHVVLKDVPIGAWTTAIVFDVLDLIRTRREFALAADASIAIGLAAATGAAVTGLTDWSDVDPPARRTGLIHGLLNISATALFATSLILRKKKSRAVGRISAALGYAVMSYAAHFGGKMVSETSLWEAEPGFWANSRQLFLYPITEERQGRFAQYSCPRRASSRRCQSRRLELAVRNGTGDLGFCGVAPPLLCDEVE
jgi:uncharacterized membrane protein